MIERLGPKHALDVLWMFQTKCVPGLVQHGEIAVISDDRIVVIAFRVVEPGVAAGIGAGLSVLFLATGSLLAPLVAHYLINLLQLIRAREEWRWLQEY